MRKLITGLMALAFVTVAVSARPAAPTGEKSQPKLTAFDKFRQKEMQDYRTFARSLMQQQLSREELTTKLKTYVRGIMARYEKFRDSADGMPFKLDVNKEIIDIAVSLGDDKKVGEVIATEKEPVASKLRLHAARDYSTRFGGEDKALKLLKEAENAAKKYPALAKEVKTAKFNIAPAGMVFPEFPKGTKDLDGKPIKIADYKGKVVLVDFWASWCGPCLREEPNIIRVYKKYHPKGFEIIGVSLDRDKSAMLKAMEKYGMTWRQTFDGRGWENKVSTAYDIRAIPAVYLIGPDGKIVTNKVRGAKLEAELAKLLGDKSKK